MIKFFKKLNLLMSRELEIYFFVEGVDSINLSKSEMDQGIKEIQEKYKVKIESLEVR